MRRPRIVIAGFPIFQELAHSVLKNISIPHWVDIEIKELPTQIISEPSEQSIDYLKSLYPGDPSTIIISGDRSSLGLAKALENLVIPVKVTGFDILEAIKDSEAKTIYVLNFIENLAQLEGIADNLNVTLIQKSYKTRTEAKKILEHLQQNGVKEVVGGSWIATIAKSYGMKGLHYYSSHSMSSAVHNALNVLRAYRNEMEKATLFNTIVEMNKNGTITTDHECNIAVVSPSAEKLLGVTKQTAVGQNIKKIIPDLNIDKVLKETRPQYNVLFQHGLQSMVADIVPVILEQDLLGLMIAVDNVKNLQEKEMQIRKQINKKPLKANYTFHDIIGTSKAIQNTIKRANKFSKTDSTILIQAETGTGKELFAQSIHNASNRRNHSFVAINCAALPENLLNSELFGYEEGAFTGAKKGGKPGLFELAHRGTIFLDEISELPLHLQSRLLRVIQEKEVMRVGGSKVIPIDVRIIAATNKNLLQSVQEKKFREDLYFRINVLQLHIPPLRERLEDIPILLNYLFRNDPHLSHKLLHSDDFLKLLTSYQWPGNVREFENIIERFKVFCYGEELSEKNIVKIMEQVLYPEPDSNFTDPLISYQNMSLDQVETRLIHQALSQSKGNKEEAAKRLGISRTTLWRKLKQSEKK